MPYPEFFVAPMRQELRDLGIRELRTAEEVDTAIANTPGTLMVVVNSVCGCAAGKARPGIALALRHVDGSRAIRRKRSRAAEGDLEGAFLGRRVQAPIAPARADEGRDCSIGCDSKDAVVTVFRCDDRAIREERPS